MAPGTSKSALWYQANRDRVCAAQRADYAANPDKYKSKTLKAKFGITLAEFDALSEHQAGLCAICTDALPRGKGCHVDHNHATGEIRGLLCNTCNVGLGMFQDRSEVLRGAATYLEIH
jgi:hypothetical protein